MCFKTLAIYFKHGPPYRHQPAAPRARLAWCGPFEIVAAAARSGPQTAKPPARLGVVPTQGRGATTPPPRFLPGGGGGPRGRNTAIIIQGRFSAPGTLAGKIARQTRQKKGKAATRPQGLALPFFWAAQAAQTLAPQGLAGASARPRRPGGRTAARAGAGRRHRTRHRPCAVGLPGVWMAARHRCRARQRFCPVAVLPGTCGPQAAPGGVGAGAGGQRPGAPDSAFRSGRCFMLDKVTGYSFRIAAILPRASLT